MSKFTPGPWFYVGGADKRAAPFIRAKGDEVGTAAVAQVCSRGGATQIAANAHLMAASPELYAAAEFVLRGIKAGHIKCAPYFDFDPTAEQIEFKPVAALLESALAKARGEA